MAESSTRGRRPRRSTRISQRLERARQRNADQLAEQRWREQRVEDALREFIEAGEAIAAEDAACEAKVAALQRKIDALCAESRERVTGEHTRQAQAALAIHEAGRTVEQVGELLELRSEKEARRLITAGRTAAEAGSGPAQERDTVPAKSSGHRPTGAAAGEETTGAVSGEQRQLRGVDGQQHRPDSGFVPAAVADGGRQNA
ncbi:hypothetical protein [Saccharopolyspora endophytica]|uniref:Uncharacterized protein n=1 Tax=Saccharopolyspora endophytica TaxID=543886 RepID=A0ABS5DMU5_9PSEU|nr:hypothetical protein [Saccharopolyspora endophytica]MBQ0927555.1 hypothetical protein [Saccharopolyspora endophytica]